MPSPPHAAPPPNEEGTTVVMFGEITLWRDLPLGNDLGFWHKPPNKQWPDLGEALDRIAVLEADLTAMNKMRTHCEHCGADYVATGIEAGCTCQLQQQLAAARAETERLAGEVPLLRSALGILRSGRTRADPPNAPPAAKETNDE